MWSTGVWQMLLGSQRGEGEPLKRHGRREGEVARVSFVPASQSTDELMGIQQAQMWEC